MDGLGDLRTVLRDRFGERVRLRTVGTSKSWFRRRLGFALSSPDGLDSHEAFVNGIVNVLEARALWARYGI